MTIQFAKDVPWDNAMDINNLAEYLGFAASTLRVSYQEWEIPHVRIAGRVFFLEPEVRKWQEQRLAEQRHRAEAAEQLWTKRRDQLMGRAA